MAVSVSIVDRSVFGDRRVVVADVTGDSSYPAGGEALTAADLGLEAIKYASVGSWVDPGATDLAYVAAVDHASDTSVNLLAFASAGDGDPLDEEAAATDLSGYTLRIFAYGW